MSDTSWPASDWRMFWNRGGWWRSVLAVVAYFGLYQLGGLVFAPLMGSGDPVTLIYVGYAMPIALGCVILLAFAWSLGWLRELFGPQPIPGGGWMWTAVVVVVLFNVLHFASIDYGKAGAGLVAAWLVSGLFVGIAEETLTRGFVVTLMRKGGYREITVATVSAALFAALHLGNLVGGQGLATTLIQVFYTFGFGLCMYLALRVTRSLIWPILLHATTDPSIFLMNTYPASGPLPAFAGLGNPVVIVVGLVLLAFIRGRVATAADAAEAFRRPA